MALLAFVNTHTTFDGFVLPNILNKPMQGVSTRLRLAETPNRPGEYTAGGKRASGKLSVIGRIVQEWGGRDREAAERWLQATPALTPARRELLRSLFP